MIEPSRVPGDHNLFICSDSESTKKELITHLSAWLGSKPENIVDPGDITAARHGDDTSLDATFQGALGHPHFNYQIVGGH